MSRDHVASKLNLVATCGLAVLAAAGCTPPAVETPTCYEPLDLSAATLPVPPTAKDNIAGDWDCFSWSSFAALNWPAGDRRGFPDLDLGAPTFETADSNAQTVWETFKEKREIFRKDGNPDRVWNSPQDFPIDPIAIHNDNDGFCLDVSEEQKAAAAGVDRHLLSTTKLAQTLDETAEVSSEALETNNLNCRGHVPDPDTACRSQTPPTCCQVNGQKVGPRVWKGMPKDDQPVYYEVRLNWDFFNYVIEQGYFEDEVTYTDAILGQVALPYRIAASKRPGDSQNVDAVTAYSTEKCLENYDPAREPLAETPCGVGAIQLKSAWIELPTPFDSAIHSAGDDPDLYHTSQAITYRPSTVERGKVCKQPGTFGLIGLHIIQRVHSGKNGGAGGAFVFSTWEHDGILTVDTHNENKVEANYSYVNYLAGLNFPLTNPPSYPTTEHALPVLPMTESRLLPATRKVNAAAYEQLAAAGSVWQNYQLIGTQFRPFVDASTSLSKGQPHFLANLVIETNLGLQLFQGLPPQNPAVLPPQYAASDPAQRLVPQNRAQSYARNHFNIAFQGSAFNQGGCMGCHGVAQQNGYSFSFVLLGGQRGGDIDSEITFSIPSPPLPLNSLPLSIGLDLPTQKTNQLPPPSRSLLAATGTSPGDAVVLASAEPGTSLQQWTLNAALPDSPPQLQGNYQIANGELMLRDQPGPAQVVGTQIGQTGNFWQLIPHEVDIDPDPTDKREFTTHLYNYLIRGLSSDMVLTRSADGTTVTVEAAAPMAAPEGSGEPTKHERQLWRLVVAPELLD